jgi:RAQPRD family integrative conjugative element protein
MSIKTRVTVGVLIALLCAFEVSATTSEEAAALERVTQEIRFLRDEVKNIQKLQRADELESFDYDALSRDLSEIQEAIERHIKTPSREPKSVAPLSADYDRAN